MQVKDNSLTACELRWVVVNAKEKSPSQQNEQTHTKQKLLMLLNINSLKSRAVSSSLQKDMA